MGLEEALTKLCPNLRGDKLFVFLPFLKETMERHKIDTPARQAAFLAQICHESQGLTRWEENLNYKADRLMQVWPNRFPTLAIAQAYAGRPERIANKVYSGRMGNGNEASGDGWRFRGRGPIQLTGRENYRRMGKKLGLNLEALPDQVATPAVGFSVAGIYWTERNLNAFADLGDVEEVTKKINGGTTGLAQRQSLTTQALELLA